MRRSGRLGASRAASAGPEGAPTKCKAAANDQCLHAACCCGMRVSRTNFARTQQWRWPARPTHGGPRTGSCPADASASCPASSRPCATGPRLPARARRARAACPRRPRLGSPAQVARQTAQAPRALAPASPPPWRADAVRRGRRRKVRDLCACGRAGRSGLFLSLALKLCARSRTGPRALRPRCPLRVSLSVSLSMAPAMAPCSVSISAR